LTEADLTPGQQIEKVYLPEKTKRTEMLEGKPSEVAARLIEKLRFESRVL
jgi:electron transfer flavoprotein beta subunit